MNKKYCPVLPFSTAVSWPRRCSKCWSISPAVGVFDTHLCAATPGSQSQLADQLSSIPHHDVAPAQSSLPNDVQVPSLQVPSLQAGLQVRDAQHFSKGIGKSSPKPCIVLKFWISTKKVTFGLKSQNFALKSQAMLAELEAVQDRFKEQADRSGLQPSAVQAGRKQRRHGNRKGKDRTHKPLYPSWQHAAGPRAGEHRLVQKRPRYCRVCLAGLALTMATRSLPFHGTKPKAVLSPM